MAIQRLEDKSILNLIPESEKARIEEFRESFFSFIKSYNPFIESYHSFIKIWKEYQKGGKNEPAK